MAVTVSAVTFLTPPASNLAQATITATADADTTTGLFAHGMSFTPNVAIITPVLPQGALKAWSWDQANTGATNIRFIGNNVTGSGVAGVSVQLWFGQFHTLIR